MSDQSSSRDTHAQGFLGLPRTLSNRFSRPGVVLMVYGRVNSSSSGCMDFTTAGPVTVELQHTEWRVAVEVLKGLRV